MKKQTVLIIILLIAGGVLGNILRFTGRLPDRMPDFSRIPNQIGNIAGHEIYFDETTYEILKADTSTYRDYVLPDQSHLALFVAYFKSQKYGSQIHSPKHCLPGGGWRIETIRPFRLHLADSSIKQINLLTIASGEYKSIMFYWYETRSGAIRSEYGLKLDLVKNALLFRPTDAAIVRLTVDVPDGDLKKAIARGTDFLKDCQPYLSESLPF